MAPEAFAELERLELELKQQQEEKAESTRKWKFERKMEKKQAKFLLQEKRRIAKQEKKEKYWAEKQAKLSALNVIDDKVPSLTSESEIIQAQMPVQGQTFFNQQYMSNNANEQYYYENLEKPRMIHQFDQEAKFQPEPQMV